MSSRRAGRWNPDAEAVRPIRCATRWALPRFRGRGGGAGDPAPTAGPAVPTTPPRRLRARGGPCRPRAGGARGAGVEPARRGRRQDRGRVVRRPRRGPARGDRSGGGRPGGRGAADGGLDGTSREPGARGGDPARRHGGHDPVADGRGRRAEARHPRRGRRRGLPRTGLAYGSLGLAWPAWRCGLLCERDEQSARAMAGRLVADGWTVHRVDRERWRREPERVVENAGHLVRACRREAFPPDDEAARLEASWPSRAHRRRPVSVRPFPPPP